MKHNVRKNVLSLMLAVLTAAAVPSAGTSAEEKAKLAEEKVIVTEKAQKRKNTSSEKVRFTAEKTDCTDGEDNGTLTIRIENGGKNDIYFYSLNGGNTYHRMSGRKLRITDVKSDDYAVCVMKNNDESTVSDIKALYIADEDKAAVDISAESTAETIYRDGTINVHIENYDREQSYEISFDAGDTWRTVKGHSLTLSNAQSKVYQVCARIKNSPEDTSVMLSVPVSDTAVEGKGYIRAESILQNPDLPTGCEITSLTMLLNHIGFEVDKLVMADHYLPKGEYRNSDFYEVFVGDPRHYSAYGCFSRPIAEAAEEFLDKYDQDSVWEVNNITGCSPDDLYRAIDQGHPVVVWASGGMGDIYAGKSWTIEETGKTMVWPANEHCLLLIGYDKEQGLAYFNDPMVGKVGYSMELFEKRFDQLNNHAVIITN
ncbi:MAG: C39 family peptidase [Oscillospiraceae bacterium]|nr:C39 family peptidase [Oscillospiraceae bacterium]